jgi:hypothetical protein
MRCRAGLGLRPTVLPAITLRRVSVASALFLSVRVVVPNGLGWLAEPLLRQRRDSAAVAYPAWLTCQDLTGAALDPLPVISLRPLYSATASS